MPGRSKDIIFSVLAELAFYHSNQRLMPKRAAKFANRASSEVRYLEFNRVTLGDVMMERRASVERWNIIKRRMPCCLKQKSHKNGIAVK